MGTKIVLFFFWSDETKIELFSQYDHRYVWRKKRGLQAEEYHPNREAQGCSIMLWGCFAAGGTGALHKIDGIIRNENDVAILKQHLKTSVRKLKLGHK